MKVMKFGGSTFKNPEMMQKVADIIVKEKKPKIVVVSALYGQTNEIREYIEKIRTEKKEIEAFVGKIRNRHKSFAENVISDHDTLEWVLENMYIHLQKLERLLFGVAYTEELTPRTVDLILSSGERMSAYIMEGVLLCNKVKAKAFEADKIGIITDGVFRNATADLPKCEKNLKNTIIPELKRGIVPVITGFFGRDEEGRCTTFGKNGSDYSAAVIACATNSDILELWKDVDGFLSADPKIIPNAYTIDKLSYDEAAELAYFGMSLLHPRTVGPCRLKDIPVQINNVLKPNGCGTTILKTGVRTENVIKSVVYSTDLGEVRVSGAGAGYRSGVLSLVASILGKYSINIYSVTTSHTHMSLLIHSRDLRKCKKAFSEIYGGVIESIEFQKDIALICIVGEGARSRKGLAKDIFAAVADAQVNVEIISAGASSVASHFIVKTKDLNKAISALHNMFCVN
jgi:aspartate kinase